MSEHSTNTVEKLCIEFAMVMKLYITPTALPLPLHFNIGYLGSGPLNKVKKILSISMKHTQLCYVPHHFVKKTFLTT